MILAEASQVETLASVGFGAVLVVGVLILESWWRNR